MDHINVLEMKAGLFGLRSSSEALRNTHVKLNMDSTTAVAYLRNMGGSTSRKCNALAHTVWEFCQKHQIWLSAPHLPGHLNVLADEKSRVFNDKTEWKLNQMVYQDIVHTFTIPDIDLFASRLNFQLKPYVAWMPDPGARFTDAFTLDWSNFVFYAFPSFSMITRVLRKIEFDGAKGILVILRRLSSASLRLILRRLSPASLRLILRRLSPASLRLMLNPLSSVHLPVLLRRSSSVHLLLLMLPLHLQVLLHQHAWLHLPLLFRQPSSIRLLQLLLQDHA